MGDGENKKAELRDAVTRGRVTILRAAGVVTALVSIVIGAYSYLFVDRPSLVNFAPFCFAAAVFAIMLADEKKRAQGYEGEIERYRAMEERRNDNFYKRHRELRDQLRGILSQVRTWETGRRGDPRSFHLIGARYVDHQAVNITLDEIDERLERMNVLLRDAERETPRVRALLWGPSQEVRALVLTAQEQMDTAYSQFWMTAEHGEPLKAQSENAARLAASEREV